EGNSFFITYTVDGRQLVKENGAEFVVDHSKGEYWEELKEAYPSGFDVILEMLANANLEHDFELVANNGCVCFFALLLLVVFILLTQLQIIYTLEVLRLN
uniref:Alcohol dehydrogenase-like C-terminal domain-containing protein n=1 Tax=Parascaris equorum TaxID=6256 RepID=A0A914RCM5_PAREQ